jgi:hypothetical protein
MYLAGERPSNRRRLEAGAWLRLRRTALKRRICRIVRMVEETAASTSDEGAPVLRTRSTSNGNCQVPGIPPPVLLPMTWSWNACSTSLCSRCASTSPEVHETPSPVGVATGLGSSVIVLDR